jgi:hypothetical protein
VGELALPAHEGGQSACAERERPERFRLAEAVLAGLLDAPDERDHAGDREHDADRVPGARVGTSPLGDQPQHGDDGQEHDRHLQGEDPRPVENLEQGAADDGANGEAAGGDRRPDPHRDRALAIV